MVRWGCSGGRLRAASGSSRGGRLIRPRSCPGRTETSQSLDSPQLECVDSWDEGLRLLDRYPWARLHPMEVHPEFVERLRAAVAERLARISDRRERERAREKWERVLNAAESREGVT